MFIPSQMVVSASPENESAISTSAGLLFTNRFINESKQAINLHKLSTLLMIIDPTDSIK